MVDANEHADLAKIDQIPVGAFAEPFAGAQSVAAIAASGTVDSKYLDERADRFATDVGTEFCGSCSPCLFTSAPGWLG